MNAKAVVRGCGRRKAGAIYIEVPTSPFGQPLEYFLQDPPIVVDLDAVGLSAVGVKLIEKDGVYHIWDVVGSEHYKNVADFVEEARRFGISRRLSKMVDFSKITAESRLILLHSRAHIAQRQEYLRDRQLRNECPKGLSEHADHHLINDIMCIGLCWEDIEGGVPVTVTDDTATNPRAVDRKMPAFTYQGFMRPQGYGQSAYEVAIFGSFPVGRLVVVNDKEGGSHERAMEAVSKSSLERALVAE